MKEMNSIKFMGLVSGWCVAMKAGIILCVRPANERRRFSVAPSLHWLGAYTEFPLKGNTGESSSHKLTALKLPEIWR